MVQNILLRSDVRERLVRLIQEITNIPAVSITDTATIDEDIQMNSVSFVELQVAIEEAYDIQIDPIQVVELNEFGSIVDYVYQCATAAAQ
jgi:acyl carrier protein